MRSLPLLLAALATLYGCGSSSSQQVVLTAQRGTWAGTQGAIDWVTLRRVSVDCQPPSTASSRRSTTALCFALRYYRQHSTQDRCSYASTIGPMVPIRILIDGTLDGESEHLTMGMVCNPPPALGHAVTTIFAAAYRHHPSPPSNAGASATTASDGGVRAPQSVTWSRVKIVGGAPAQRRELRQIVRGFGSTPIRMIRIGAPPPDLQAPGTEPSTM